MNNLMKIDFSEALKTYFYLDLYLSLQKFGHFDAKLLEMQTLILNS